MFFKSSSKLNGLVNMLLHLQTVYDMLLYLAASGHNLHAKSAYTYIQMMANLKDSHPYVYKNVQDGLDAVKRSDHYWAGLSLDLIIEQVVLRSVKNTDGLT